MQKTAVIYWSGTGNTEAMAKAVAEGAKAAGAEVGLFSVDEFDAAKMDEFDAFAFGCEARLNGRPVGLFGSYGWGDGEWMRTWEDNCKSAGVNLAADSVICQEAPDDEAEAACRALGAVLAG